MDSLNRNYSLNQNDYVSNADRQAAQKSMSGKMGFGYSSMSDEQFEKAMGAGNDAPDTSEDAALIEQLQARGIKAEKMSLRERAEQTAESQGRVFTPTHQQQVADAVRSFDKDDAQALINAVDGDTSFKTTTRHAFDNNNTIGHAYGSVESILDAYKSGSLTTKQTKMVESALQHYQNAYK